MQDFVGDHALCLIAYFASGRGAKYCDQRVCMSAYLFVCLSSRIYLNNCIAKFHHIFCTRTKAVTRSSCGDIAIRYVLPVLRMTSHFHIMEGIMTTRMYRPVRQVA